MKEYGIKLHFEKLDNGEYLATSEDIPGLLAQGRTIQETIEIAQDVFKKIIDSYIEHNDPLPDNLKILDKTFDFEMAVAI